MKPMVSLAGLCITSFSILLATYSSGLRANLKPADFPDQLNTAIAPLLSTKTPYFFTSKANPPGAPEHCQLVHINHLGRHGSRHIANIRLFEEEVLARAGRLGLVEIERKDLSKPLLYARFSMPEKALPAEGKWLSAQILKLAKTYQGNPELLGRLTELGKRELEQLGNRLLAYTGLNRGAASDLVRNRRITAATTSLIRTETSRDHFLKGLGQFLNTTPDALQLELITAAPGISDPQLQPYDICSKYQFKQSLVRQIGNLKADEFLAQSRAWQNEKVVEAFLGEFSDWQQQDLTALLYRICQMDADDGYRLGLCQHISEKIGSASMARIFADHSRAANIKVFYRLGPAKEFSGLNRLMMINLLNAFLEATRKAIGDPDSPILSLRFAHDSTLLRFLQILNIITEENSSQGNEVTWNISELTPMAGNLVWQTWACNVNTDSEEKQHAYKVRMLFNEEPIHFPIDNCEKSDPFCDWAEVEAYYRRVSEETSLEQACDGLLKPLESGG